MADPKALARAGLTQVVDVADVTLSAVLTAVEETQNVVVAGGQAAINVGDKTTDQLLTEARGLQSQFIFSMRKIIDSLGDVAAEVVTGDVQSQPVSQGTRQPANMQSGVKADSPHTSGPGSPTSGPENPSPLGG